MTDHDFIPNTMEREIAPNIVFRPIRSWHSLTYAGENIRIVKCDRSGCIDDNGRCRPPLTVTHRIYWNKLTSKSISSFLSYPNGMGAVDKYFWGIYAGDGIERFLSEIEMEQAIIGYLR